MAAASGTGWTSILSEGNICSRTALSLRTLSVYITFDVSDMYLHCALEKLTSVTGVREGVLMSAAVAEAGVTAEVESSPFELMKSAMAYKLSRRSIALYVPIIVVVVVVSFAARRRRDGRCQPVVGWSQKRCVSDCGNQFYVT